MPVTKARKLAKQPISEIRALKPAKRPKRDRILRTRRIRTDELSFGRVVAKAYHSGVGDFVAEVLDLSAYGMRLVLGAHERDGLIFAGDRIDALKLQVGEQTLSVGPVLAKRVEESPTSQIIGVELSQGTIDLAAIYSLDRRRAFHSRLVQAEETGARVSREFKTWISDVSTYFHSVKKFLDAEESALWKLDQWSREQAIAEYIQEAGPQISDRLMEYSIGLGQLVSGLSDAEHDQHRSYYRRHLCRYYHYSPLLRRAYEKPLGYAGDYEMMNMLYRDHAEGESMFAKIVNMYACKEPAAAANVNRLEFFSARIIERLHSTPGGPLQIASIGCGPSQEIRLLLEKAPELGPRLDIALIDQEEAAITYCEHTLGRLASRTGARIRFIRESIRTLLTSRRLADTLGPRDFIYSAGLFDYLGDRSFVALLKALFGALTPGGELYAGNVNVTNTSRWSMEYGADWYLMHRTPTKLLDFAGELATAPTSCTIEQEPLGVNLFLHMVK